MVVKVAFPFGVTVCIGVVVGIEVVVGAGVVVGLGVPVEDWEVTVGCGVEFIAVAVGFELFKAEEVCGGVEEAVEAGFVGDIADVWDANVERILDCAIIEVWDTCWVEDWGELFKPVVVGTVLISVDWVWAQPIKIICKSKNKNIFVRLILKVFSKIFKKIELIFKIEFFF